MRRVLSLLCALAALAPARAGAGEPPEATAQTTRTQDIGDLWRGVRHKAGAPGDTAIAESPKPFLVVAPTIGSKPSTGLTAGFSTNIAFFRGDPTTTHISSMNGGLRISQKGQTLAGVRFSAFSSNDRWFFQSDNRLSWTSQNTYGLGASTTAAEAESVKYNLFRFYETAYRRVRPGLFVGVGLDVSDHANVRVTSDQPATAGDSAFAAYTRKHALATSGQISSGASLGLLFDTRDNLINAQRGWFANANYRTFFDGFLGGDSTWQELYVDVRTYKKLTGDARHKVAFWALGDFVTGGIAPYFDLPATGGQDRSARGYGEGRYRGEHLLYGEAEYRGALTRNGLLGFVAFINATTVDSNETGEKLFSGIAPGAGFGFRFLLNKHSRTNLCTDYGWGKASDGRRTPRPLALRPS
jgi:hypothetical protein